MTRSLQHPFLQLKEKDVAGGRPDSLTITDFNTPPKQHLSQRTPSQPPLNIKKK